VQSMKKPADKRLLVSGVSPLLTALKSGAVATSEASPGAASNRAAGLTEHTRRVDVQPGNQAG
jgi:hypothetical protein